MSFYSNSDIKKEQDIIELYGSGLSQSQIAKQLNVTEGRVAYAIMVRDEMGSISPNGENKEVIKPMKDPVLKGISDKKQELWNRVIGFHNEGLTQKQIAIKLNRSQSYIAKILRDIRNKDATLLKDKSRDHGTRRRYTKEEKERLTTEILEMYNAGMTVEEIANLKDKASSTVERWISNARKEGRDVRSSKQRKQVETVKIETPPTQDNKEQQESENDELLGNIVNAINAFSDSHFLLSKHIDKLFEILERKESDGR